MTTRRIFAAIALLCAMIGGAPAQTFTKAQINAQVGVNFPDNTNFLILPANARTVFDNIVNSIMPTAPVVSGNLACFDGTTGLLKDCGTAPSTVNITVGATTITSGTNTRVVYDNNGIFGEYTNAQLTALINLATTSLAGALPAWPNNTTTAFLGNGTYGQINLANAVTGLLPNANLVTAVAATIKGNPTASTASVQDFAVNALTAASVCNSSADFLVKFDSATGTLQKASCGLVAAASTAGVSSLNGLTGTLVGADLSTINAQSSGYSIVSSDCGKVIYATGGMNTITLPSTSGFPAACTITVKNGETYTGTAGRAKILSGFPADLQTRLWPLQSVTVKIESSSWIATYNPGQWFVPTQVTLHVDKTNGNNANDCLAATTGACQDAQAAWTIQQYQFDNQGSSPIIAMACSQTHTVALNAGGTPVGTNLVQLSPDGNCAFTWTNVGPCISVGDNAELNLNLIQYGSSGAATFGCNSTDNAATGNIYLHNNGVLDLEGTPIWNPAGVSDNFLFCDGLCQFTIANGITQATGNGANYVINMSAGGHGTQSGIISATGSGGLQGIYYLFGAAILNLGTSSGSGWSSVGASKVYGHATMVNNGITIAGGVTVGASGVNCSSLLSNC